MKTCVNSILNSLPLAALLVAGGMNADGQSQNFTWTVTGTGTETWFTQSVTYSTKDASTSDPFNPTDTEYITAGASGQATYSVSINAGTWPGTCGGSISYGNMTIFSDSVGNGNKPPYKNDSGSFSVLAGQTYTLYAWISGGPGESSDVQVTVPQSVQTITHTASRTNSQIANNEVAASDGQKNIGNFYAAPQPVNGGTMSGISYSLTWNNPQVVLFFSDTKTTTTTNPNADIIAILVQTPVISQIIPALTNALVTCTGILPGGSATWLIFSNGISIPSLASGTGANPNTDASTPWTFGIGNGSVPGVGCLEPGTVYQVAIRGQFEGMFSSYVTNGFTTLPEPTLTGLYVAQTNVTSIVFAVPQGITTNYSIGCSWSANGVTNYVGTGAGPNVGPTRWEITSLQPNTTYNFVFYESDLISHVNGAFVTTNVTTLPMPIVPANIVIVPTASNAVGSCTVVLAESVGYQIMQNGTNVQGLAGGTGLDIPYVNPIYFGIGFWDTPLQPNTTYQAVVWGWSAGITTASTTNTFTTCPAAPVITRIVPGITNAIVTCTGILSGGSAGIWVYTNGVQIPSLCTGTSIISTTNPSNPITFGIGNGSVPGVTCLEPATTYQVVIAGQLNGQYSSGVTNTFTTLEPLAYNALVGQLLSGGEIRLSFVGNAGGNYALEHSYSLAPANWIPVVTNSADSFGALILTNTISTSGNNFWRVRSLP